MDALDRTGRLGDTLIVFMSDNGFEWGEHRWRSKIVPYEESIRIPLLMRFDGVLPAGVDVSGMALNIDIADTISDLTGVSFPPNDGTSLLPLVNGQRWRNMFVVERWNSSPAANGVPSYCGVRTSKRLFVRYATGEEEFYQLRADPYELNNAVHKRAALTTVERMRARAKQLCSPLPPGMPPFP